MGSETGKQRKNRHASARSAENRKPAHLTVVVVYMTIKDSKRGGRRVRRKTAGKWQSETGI